MGNGFRDGPDLVELSTTTPGLWTEEGRNEAGCPQQQQPCGHRKTANRTALPGGKDGPMGSPATPQSIPRETFGLGSGPRLEVAAGNQRAHSTTLQTARCRHGRILAAPLASCANGFLAARRQPGPDRDCRDDGRGVRDEDGRPDSVLESGRRGQGDRWRIRRRHDRRVGDDCRRGRHRGVLVTRSAGSGRLSSWAAVWLRRASRFAG